jgi:hypothetical protein
MPPAIFLASVSVSRDAASRYSKYPSEFRITEGRRHLINDSNNAGKKTPRLSAGLANEFMQLLKTSSHKYQIRRH